MIKELENFIHKNKVYSKCNQEEKDLIDSAIEAAKRERETMKNEIKLLIRKCRSVRKRKYHVSYMYTSRNYYQGVGSCCLTVENDENKLNEELLDEIINFIKKYNNFEKLIIVNIIELRCE